MKATENATNTVFVVYIPLRIDVISVFVADSSTGLCVYVTPVMFADPLGLFMVAAVAIAVATAGQAAIVIPIQAVPSFQALLDIFANWMPRRCERQVVMGLWRHKQFLYQHDHSLEMRCRCQAITQIGAINHQIGYSISLASRAQPNSVLEEVLVQGLSLKVDASYPLE